MVVGVWCGACHSPPRCVCLETLPTTSPSVPSSSHVRSVEYAGLDARIVEGMAFVKRIQLQKPKFLNRMHPLVSLCFTFTGALNNFFLLQRLCKLDILVPRVRFLVPELEHSPLRRYEIEDPALAWT